MASIDVLARSSGRRPASGEWTTELSGGKLVAARAAWFVVAGLALTAFATGVPAAFQQGLTISTATRSALAAAGLSERFPAFFFLGTDIATLAAFTLIAALLFWRRSTDWLAMFVGMMLILTALIYTHAAADAPVPAWLNGTLFGLGEISQVAFFYLFPDGRPVPRRSGWLLAPLLVWRPAMWALVYVPAYRALTHTAESYGYIPQSSIDILLLVGLFLAGIGAQVYRYRYVSNAARRQQAKWLLFGTGITVAVVGSYVFAFNVLQLPDRLGSSSFFLLATSRTIRQLALLAVPVALTISVLRYRLFDIDVLINRALVYGVLSLTLMLVYGATVVVLQQAFLALSGDISTLADVGSALAIVTLFQPLRRRVQELIDRRFYRRRYDASRTLAAFSAVVRDEVDLAKLTEDLLAVVADTMQPAEISLWLRSDAAPRIGERPAG